MKLDGSSFKLPNVVCSSPVEVLQKYSATLQELMDPDASASHLFSKGLLSLTLHDQLLTALGLSSMHKARLIMNELIHTMGGGDVMHNFKTLCAILKTDCTYMMKEVVLKLEEEVGVSQGDD